MVSPINEELAPPHLAHTAKFRITNNGKFPAHVTFSMLTSAEEPPEPPAELSTPAAPGTFILHPPDFTLPLGETRDITVRAYPPRPGHVGDYVVCNVADNPEPVMFRVACLGAVPQVQVLLPGEEVKPQEAAPKAEEAVEVETGKGGGKGAKGGKGGGKGAKGGKGAPPPVDENLPRVGSRAFENAGDEGSLLGIALFEAGAELGMYGN